MPRINNKTPNEQMVFYSLQHYIILSCSNPTLQHFSCKERHNLRDPPSSSKKRQRYTCHLNTLTSGYDFLHHVERRRIFINMLAITTSSCGVIHEFNYSLINPDSFLTILPSACKVKNSGPLAARHTSYFSQCIMMQVLSSGLLCSQGKQSTEKLVNLLKD